MARRGDGVDVASRDDAASSVALPGWRVVGEVGGSSRRARLEVELEHGGHDLLERLEELALLHRQPEQRQDDRLRVDGGGVEGWRWTTVGGGRRAEGAGRRAEGRGRNNAWNARGERVGGGAEAVAWIASGARDLVLVVGGAVLVSTYLALNSRTERK